MVICALKGTYSPSRTQWQTLRGCKDCTWSGHWRIKLWDRNSSSLGQTPHPPPHPGSLVRTGKASPSPTRFPHPLGIGELHRWRWSSKEVLLLHVPCDTDRGQEGWHAVKLAACCQRYVAMQNLNLRKSDDFSMKMCMAQELYPCFREDEI